MRYPRKPHRVATTGSRVGRRSTPESGRVVLPLGPVALDALTEAAVVDRIVSAASDGHGGLVVTPNVDHLRQLHAGDWLGAVYAEADLVVADGMPLVWAARLQGTPVPERVAGSELLWTVSAAAAAAGVSIYLLGGADGAAQATAVRLAERYPGIRIAGVSCPPRGFERRPGAIDEIGKSIAEAGAGIVFTALGAPKQELLNSVLRRELPSVWFLGVGAAFDMAAGVTPRAPVWAQRSGLEWLFRLAREPRRLARRYLLHGLPFATRLIVAAAAAGRRNRRSLPR